MNDCIYIHETVDVTGHNKAKYVDYMCEYAPVSRTERKMPLFGIWTVVGSTGQWPQAINLWEAADWAGMAHNFAYETQGASHYDEKLTAWMHEAVKLRTGGFDRIMAAAPWSPSSDEVADNSAIVGAKVFLQETFRLHSGTAKTFLDRLYSQWLPVANSLGMTLTCALRTMMQDDAEVIVIWAFREWQDWAQAEYQMDNIPAVIKSRDSLKEFICSRRSILLCPGSRSPLKTGIAL